jgi:hypothetical protein
VDFKVYSVSHALPGPSKAVVTGPLLIGALPLYTTHNGALGGGSQMGGLSRAPPQAEPGH